MSSPWYDIPEANQDSQPVNTPTSDSYTRLIKTVGLSKKESTGSVNNTWGTECPFQPTTGQPLECKTVNGSNICLAKETDPSKCGYGCCKADDGSHYRRQLDLSSAPAFSD